MSRELIIAPAWIGRSGLWLPGPKGRREVDAEDVGLSEELADRLEAWMDMFDAIYDEDEPTASAFADAVQEMAWLAEGEAIAVAMVEDLGAGWTVTRDFTGWRQTA
ncbi:MAG: hypothetical protein DI527_07940 [Chelatococcus sp.]|nr:MAG: hypothetical protein DI527_07940 [Chelatococcus sp.]